MVRFDFGAHSSSNYNEDLAAIHRDLTEMGQLVQRQVADGVQALLCGDLALALTVLANEDRVDALEKAIDEACAYVLALRQPAATDLRLLIAVSKCVSDFERVGDESVKIATIAQQALSDGSTGEYQGVRLIGDQVSRMLAAALEAFLRLDTRKAVEVVLDMEYRTALRALLTHKAEDPEAVPHLVNITWALRSLERIGDHAHNVAEQVIYLVTGKDVRHLSASQLSDEFAATERG
jgi:phosphate transport system protein